MYNNPFIYDKDTGDYRVGMMAYKFNFDLTKIPNNLFEETYELVMKKTFNINTNKTAKKIVKKYKVDNLLNLPFPEAVTVIKDIIEVQKNNALLKNHFKRTNARALFLPHCCRKPMDSNCKAAFKSETSSYECVHCSPDCIVSQATTIAKQYNYDVYVLPGGSCISKIFAQHCYEGIIGVACMDEIKMAKQSLIELKIISQAVPLLKNGCANTHFNLSSLLDIITPA